MATLLDISGYQDEAGPLDFPRLKSAGISGVIIKATEGQGVSPYFARDAAAAHDAGLEVGAYAFTRPDTGPPVEQAQTFVRVAQTALHLDFWADDAETGGHNGAASWGDWHGQFCAVCSGALNDVRGLFYSAAWCQQFGWSFDGRVTSLGLWLAQYGGSAPGPLPGWDRVTLWQDRSNARYPGVVGPVDEDITQADLSSAALPTPPTASQPHTEEVLMRVISSPDGNAWITDGIVKRHISEPTTELPELLSMAGQTAALSVAQYTADRMPEISPVGAPGSVVVDLNDIHTGATT